jgi:hypothetical protein
MSLGLFRWYSPNSTFRRATIPRLQVHFPNTSPQVWQSIRTCQSQLAPSRPRHSASVNLMLRYGEWCCAVYQTVQKQGMSQDEAGALVEAIMTDAYRPVPAAMFKLSRLRSAKQETRVRWLLSIITRYFFSAPFRHRHLPSEDAVAFDVTRCPLADYFEDQGVPELTTHAACNLDYGAAIEMGVELVRTQTIAKGADYCDFRWKLPKKRAILKKA